MVPRGAMVESTETAAALRASQATDSVGANSADVRTQEDGTVVTLTVRKGIVEPSDASHSDGWTAARARFLAPVPHSHVVVVTGLWATKRANVE